MATELKVTTDANVSKFNLAIELQKEIEKQYLMADSITTQVISDTAGVKYVVKRTNHSDGTGETDSVLVDPTTSNFMTADGTKTIGKVWYSINTANSKSAVELAWEVQLKTQLL